MVTLESADSLLQKSVRISFALVECNRALAEEAEAGDALLLRAMQLLSDARDICDSGIPDEDDV
jgi:hypothetical protein